MIFDGFPSLAAARAFQNTAGSQGLTAKVYTTEAASDRADPFPYRLVAPIVQVQRAEPKTERYLQGRVKSFGGRFAGT